VIWLKSFLTALAIFVGAAGSVGFIGYMQMRYIWFLPICILVGLLICVTIIIRETTYGDR